MRISMWSIVCVVALVATVAAMPARAEEDKLQAALVAAPDNPQACLEMIDMLQLAAEEKVTTRRYADQVVENIGATISAIEANCQGNQYTEAWTAGVALKTLLDQTTP
jgi:hypothetical protein